VQIVESRQKILNYTLAVAACAFALVCDGNPVVENKTLTVQAAAHTHAASAPVLVQHKTLAVQAAAHAHASSVPTLKELRTLVVQAAAFTHAASSPGLGELRTLEPAAAALAHASSTPTLTEHKTLIVAPNVAVNGDMESWASATNLNTWSETLSGTSTINQEGTEKHGGAYSVRFDIDASDSYVILYQNFTLPAGSACHLSLWYKSTDAGHPHVQLFDSANNVYLTSTGAWSESAAFIHIAAAADWTEYTLDFVAHASYSTYRIWLTRGAGSSSESIYLDDVAVVATPSVSLAASAPALFQAHTLAMQSAAVTLAASAPTLAQAHVYVIDEELHRVYVIPDAAALALASSTPTLVQVHILGMSDAAFALAASEPGVVEDTAWVFVINEGESVPEGPFYRSPQPLIVASAAVVLSSSTPTLNELRTLAVNAAALAHAASSPTLDTTGDVVPDAASFALASSTPTLIEKRTLAVQNAAHTLAAESIVLQAAVVQPCVLRHTADNITLVQHYTLDIQYAAVGLTTAGPTPIQHKTLTGVAACAFTHATAGPTLAIGHVLLSISSDILTHAASAVTLTQAHTLAVNSCAFTLAATKTILDTPETDTLIVSDAAVALESEQIMMTDLTALAVHAANVDPRLYTQNVDPRPYTQTIEPHLRP
jgi:hypothetical protein